MTQKKTKPVDTKGKAKSVKPVSQKTPQKPVAKSAKAAAPAKPVAPANKAAALAKSSAAPAVKKSPMPVAPATKKPVASGKPAIAQVAKPTLGVKPVPAVKPDMSKPVVSKPAPAKAAAAAAVAPKPTLKPVVAPAPAKPAAVLAKPVAVAAKPVAAIPAKPAAPVTPVAKPAVVPPVAARPAFGGKPMFGPKPVHPAAKAPIAAPVAVAAPSEPKKSVSARHGFKTGEWIVYPAQGVGRIVAIEEQEIAGMKLELFVITFDKDKMTLRVPTGKAATVGMRKLAEEGIVKRAMETLKGKARIKRTMWSRRAQEFEAKINSGDLVSVAEVVRDLYRAESQPEQSYSERLLFERALDRMAREIAAVDKLDERGAAQRIVEVLSKSAKARRPVTEEVTTAGDDDADEATAAA